MRPRTSSDALARQCVSADRQRVRPASVGAAHAVGPSHRIHAQSIGMDSLGTLEESVVDISNVRKQALDGQECDLPDSSQAAAQSAVGMASAWEALAAAHPAAAPLLNRLADRAQATSGLARNSSAASYMAALQFLSSLEVSASPEAAYWAAQALSVMLSPHLQISAGMVSRTAVPVFAALGEVVPQVHGARRSILLDGYAAVFAHLPPDVHTWQQPALRREVQRWLLEARRPEVHHIPERLRPRFLDELQSMLQRAVDESASGDSMHSSRWRILRAARRLAEHQWTLPLPILECLLSLGLQPARGQEATAALEALRAAWEATAAESDAQTPRCVTELAEPLWRHTPRRERWSSTYTDAYLGVVGAIIPIAVAAHPSSAAERSSFLRTVRGACQQLLRFGDVSYEQARPMAAFARLTHVMPYLPPSEAEHCLRQLFTPPYRRNWHVSLTPLVAFFRSLADSGAEAPKVPEWDAGRPTTRLSVAHALLQEVLLPLLERASPDTATTDVPTALQPLQAAVAAAARGLGTDRFLRMYAHGEARLCWLLPVLRHAFERTRLKPYLEWAHELDTAVCGEWEHRATSAVRRKRLATWRYQLWALFPAVATDALEVQWGEWGTVAMALDAARSLLSLPLPQTREAFESLSREDVEGVAAASDTAEALAIEACHALVALADSVPADAPSPGEDAALPTAVRQVLHTVFDALVVSSTQLRPELLQALHRVSTRLAAARTRQTLFAKAGDRFRLLLQQCPTEGSTDLCLVLDMAVALADDTTASQLLPLTAAVFDQAPGAHRRSSALEKRVYRAWMRALDGGTEVHAVTALLESTVSSCSVGALAARLHCIEAVLQRDPSRAMLRESLLLQVVLLLRDSASKVRQAAWRVLERVLQQCWQGGGSGAQETPSRLVLPLAAALAASDSAAVACAVDALGCAARWLARERRRAGRALLSAAAQQAVADVREAYAGPLLALLTPGRAAEVVRAVLKAWRPAVGLLLDAESVSTDEAASSPSQTVLPSLLAAVVSVLDAPALAAEARAPARLLLMRLMRRLGYEAVARSFPTFSKHQALLRAVRRALQRQVNRAHRAVTDTGASSDEEEEVGGLLHDVDATAPSHDLLDPLTGWMLPAAETSLSARHGGAVSDAVDTAPRYDTAGRLLVSDSESDAASDNDSDGEGTARRRKRHSAAAVADGKRRRRDARATPGACLRGRRAGGEVPRRYGRADIEPFAYIPLHTVSAGGKAASRRASRQALQQVVQPKPNRGKTSGRARRAAKVAGR